MSTPDELRRIARGGDEAAAYERRMAANGAEILGDYAINAGSSWARETAAKERKTSLVAPIATFSPGQDEAIIRRPAAYGREEEHATSGKVTRDQVLRAAEDRAAALRAEGFAARVTVQRTTDTQYTGKGAETFDFKGPAGTKKVPVERVGIEVSWDEKRYVSDGVSDGGRAS